MNHDGFIAFNKNVLIELRNPELNGRFERMSFTRDGGLYFIDTYRAGVEATESFFTNTSRRVRLTNLGSTETLRGMHIAKSHSENLINLDRSEAQDIDVYFVDTFGTITTPTVTNGSYSQDVKLKRTTNGAGGSNQLPTWKDYYPIHKFIAGYDYEFYGEEFATFDDFTGIGVGAASDRIVLADSNITEASKATVDAYTEIENLDKLYDRAKAWGFTKRRR